MEFIYEDEFLYLSPFGKLIVRIIFAAFWVLGILLAIDLLVSNDYRLMPLGIFISLFIAFRIFHRGYTELIIDKLVLKKEFKQGRLNTFLVCNFAAKNLIRRAFSNAQIRQNQYLDVFLLQELLDQSIIKKSFKRLGIDLAKFSSELEKLRGQFLEKSGLVDALVGSNNYPKVKDYLLISLLEKINFVVGQAFNFALDSLYKSITPELLIIGVLRSQIFELRKLYADFNLSPEAMIAAINLEVLFKKLPKHLAIQPLAAFAPKKRGRRILNRAWTSRPTPFLDSISQDLTEMARGGRIGFMLGHEDEFDHLLNVLGRPGQNNVLLLGDPGVGKKTLIWHLAKRIIDDDVPDKLFDKRLIYLEVSNLVSGLAPEEAQKRFNRIVEEITAAKNIILYIEDFHNLKVVSAGSLSPYDVLKPFFKSGFFQMIGSSDEKSYQKYFATDSDFLENFEIIYLQEVSEQNATTLISIEALFLEKKFNITIEIGAIQRAVNLAKRYLRPKLLPASAKDLLDEAVEEALKVKAKKVTQQDVADLVTRITKIPIAQASGQEANQLLNLENLIHKRLIDQEEAVEQVSQALRQYRAGLARQKGPIATFLFVGPTGVGKTELSKILASVYFSGEEQMIRFDMAEFQLKESINRFIGAGLDTAGTLTQAVKDKPYSLVLLDEFEKAHPDILNLFLSVFDDGRLTDSLGNVIDFTNTIIICTSNARSDLIKQELEKGTGFQEIQDKIKKALGDFFRPELLNRFDAVVVFKSLSPDDILKIAKLNLTDIVSSLEKEQGIMVKFADSAIQEVAKQGFDPVFGARPLRRVIADRIKDKLATMILRREVQRGDEVTFAFENNNFVIKR